MSPLIHVDFFNKHVHVHVLACSVTELQILILK